MQKVTFQLFFAVWGFLLTGLLYFFSLPLHLPAWITLLVAVAVLVPVYRLFAAKLMLDTTDRSVRPQTAALLVLAGGIVFLTRMAMLQPVLQGTMDSVRMWGYYARYLAIPEWRQLFADTTGYKANHPPGLPACTAFLWRLFHSESILFPQAISYLSVLLTVVVLYLETYRVHFALSVLALIVFVTDHAFAGRSFAQCADAPMGLLLLCAVIALQQFRSSGNNWLITVSAAFLGCCIWMKNEGLLLALLYMVVYAGTFWTKQNMRRTLAGIAPFALGWAAYKLFFAMPGDIEQQNFSVVLQHFINRHYYGIIWLHFRMVLHNYFYVWQTALVLYLLMCIVRRQFPARSINVLLVATGGILLLYFITPADLEWQLGTSLERVLSQLMPALTYSLIMLFAPKAQPTTVTAG